ncbi:hypothetical protein WME99_20995 [Sorangium sp. So ce136]|uniref:hypothetical protein n=1 Tax=Sorangium sp. So ce136 TaxID=3133284 RepID=UPI003F12B008
MKTRGWLCTIATLVAACSSGEPAAPPRAPASTTAVAAAPPSAPGASASAAASAPAPDASASAGAPGSAPTASASAAASASEAPPLPPVVEVHTSAVRERFSITASGAATRRRSLGIRPDVVGHGQVAPESLEAFHKVLLDVGFCGLAPKARESAPGYIVIKAAFPDVACTVELPDKQWDKVPKAKKVIEAARKLEEAACAKGCLP